MVAQGLITNKNKHLYIVDNASPTVINGAIYEKYLDFSSIIPLQEVIYYAKNDCIDNTDINNQITYKKGFYLYNLTTSKWEYLGSTDVKLDSTVTQGVIRTITSNKGTSYTINADLIVEQIGEETITISKSLDNITLDDGTEIHVGDVLEIYKAIGGVEVYSYCIVIEPIYNPFS